jgi:Bacterial nucleoid DNA-binding protein
MALTKMEIVNSIYRQIGIPKTECIQITESIFEIIKEELENGNSVMVSGFGKWTVKSKRKHNGRNPKTGEQIVIDARKVVTFKPSLSLRDELNADN